MALIDNIKNAFVAVASDIRELRRRSVKDLPELLATNNTYPVGTIIATRTEGFSYEVVASGEHITTGNGVRLRALPFEGRYQPEQFAVNALPGVTDMAAAVQRAINTGPARLGGTYLVGSALVLPNDTDVDARGSAILRGANVPTGAFIRLSGSTVRWSGGKIDGQKALAVNPHMLMHVMPGVEYGHFSGIEFLNAKASGGWGGGFHISAGSGVQSISVEGCVARANDGAGFGATDTRNTMFTGCTSWFNGGSGFDLNNYDQTFTQLIVRCGVVNCVAQGNGSSGIVVGNFIENNNVSVPDSQRVYGYANFEAHDCAVIGNRCIDNAVYGIVVHGPNHVVSGNNVRNNGTAGNPHGGIQCGGTERLTCVGNISNGNIGYGIDAGAARFALIANNNVQYNTITGVTVEANVDTIVEGNYFRDNGSDVPNRPQVMCLATGGNGSGAYFPQKLARVSILSNKFYTTAGRRGVFVSGGAEQVTISGNDFRDAPANDAILDYGFDTIIQGNISGPAAAATFSGGMLIFPDVVDQINHNSGATVEGIRSYTSSLIPSGVSGVRVLNGGSGYTSTPTVSFSGGGGSGAAGVARVSRGQVIGVEITNNGSGYTSAPSVSFSGGGGSGATAQAQAPGVPPTNGRRISILHGLAATLKRAGTVGPNIVHTAATDLAPPANGVTQLTGRYGNWYLEGKTY